MGDLLYDGILGVTGLATGIINRDAVVEKGDPYNHIRGELGEDRYGELCRDSALEVVTIYYCQEELSSITKAFLPCRKLVIPNFGENLKKKRLINHDSLMLELRPGGWKRRAIYIVADKVGSGNGIKAGIHINLYDEESSMDFERRCCLRRIECRSQIGLLELLAILKRKSPDYDIKHDHCWHYAEKTTKFLLQACIQRKWNGSEDQKRVQKELKDLKANIVKQHVINTVKRVVNYVKSHVLH